MNFRSSLSVFAFVTLLAFTSCVSKKKHQAAIVSMKSTTAAREAEHAVEIAKMKSLNDSLKLELAVRDSLIDTLSVRLTELSLKKDKDKTKTYSKKPSSLSKEQEYERKSQFVYNFAAYIEWPVIYNGTEFVIGVAGDDNALKKVRETIGTKKLGGKKVKIEKYNKVTNYHLVYVTSANSSSFISIKNDSKKNKTVLITDDALLSAGAHISFLLDDDKVKYSVNKSSIEKIGLKVSQELMRFSE